MAAPHRDPPSLHAAPDPDPPAGGPATPVLNARPCLYWGSSKGSSARTGCLLFLASEGEGKERGPGRRRRRKMRGSRRGGGGERDQKVKPRDEGCGARDARLRRLSGSGSGFLR